MHHWGAIEWALYALFNLITAFAYFGIPYKLNKIERSELLTTRQAFLFKSFILLCGLHHLTHPLFMYQDWFILLITVDAAMAIVSLYCFFSLKFHGILDEIPELPQEE